MNPARSEPDAACQESSTSAVEAMSFVMDGKGRAEQRAGCCKQADPRWPDTKVLPINASPRRAAIFLSMSNQIKAQKSLAGSRGPTRLYAALLPLTALLRRFWKNLSTSRDSVCAAAVSSLDAVSTDDAAVLVSPIASRSEAMLVTSVWLPSAADCALAEISRVAVSCRPIAPAIAKVMSLISRTAPPISRTASTAFRVDDWIMVTF